MQSPQLLLSNTSSFFFGGIKAAFQNARKYGFDGLEIIPYRWTSPGEILSLEKRYGIKVAGIHLPPWWNKNLWQAVREPSSLFEKTLAPVWHLFLCSARNSAGLAIARVLAERKPYVLMHSNVTVEAANEFSALTKAFDIVVEKLTYYPQYAPPLWDPGLARQKNQANGVRCGLVFDPGHFSRAVAKLPGTNPVETYKQARPEIIHISYNSATVHGLPNSEEQKELQAMLKIHQPRYIVLETNPFVSIKKGKEMLDRLLKSI